MAVSVDGYLKLSSQCILWLLSTHTHIPAHTQHADKCSPTITMAQRNDGHGFCGSLDVKWPLGLMSTLALQLVCAVPDCGILEKQSPLKEEGHWRFYGQVQLRVHSLMPYLPTTSCFIHVIMSSLPWKTKHFLHWGANKPFSYVASWIFDHSNKELVQLPSNEWSIHPFIHLFNKYSNKYYGPHCVPGTKGTSMDQTKKKILITHMIWTFILAV